MEGYIQSQDKAKDRLKIGPSELSLEPVEGELRGLSLLGWYSMLQGKRVAFYRWEGGLRLRIGEEPPLLVDDAIADWSVTHNRVNFTLWRNAERLFYAEYPLSPEIMNMANDPTPFVEAEHFDILLLVKNVLEDSERKARFPST